MGKQLGEFQTLLFNPVVLINYNQERFLLASQCEDVTLSLAQGQEDWEPASSVGRLLLPAP